MSSDYDYSDVDDYSDGDEEMIDGTQDDGSASSDNEMDLDDNFCEDFKLESAKGKRKAYEIEYDSLSQSAVEALMKKDIEHTTGIFGIDEDTAALLLRYMKWNKERLIERYMDDPAKVSAAAGIPLKDLEETQPSLVVTKPIPLASTPSSSSILGRTLRKSSRKTTAETKAKPTPRVPTPPPKDGSFLCPICFDDSQKPTLALGCGHAFCSDCWRDYAEAKVRDESEHAIACMQDGCSRIAPDTFVRQALGSNSLQLQARFQELLVRNFVASNPKLKYCPYPSCTYTVSCPGAADKSALAVIVPSVTCGSNASHRFCFGCNIDSDHRPVVCGIARKWLKKCADDSETANWIKGNTKECGQCQSTIEKNGGCNHMTCKKCRHEFCWVCMGPWSEHGTAWYSCNRFEDKAGVDARDAQSKSRASLERYLHYYNRWSNHEQSAKLSLDLYAKTEKKMDEMQVTSSLTWIEVQFMKKAVEEVGKCRATLKWTYAMAYYLKKGNEKELFEDNQRDLERAVEDLSELLESPIEAEGIAALRQKVTDKTVYVQKRNEIVLEDTASGFADGRWKWNVQVEGFEGDEEDNS